ncbi:MAG: 6-carboxytetrahydropterin synthase [Bacteroidetes bacterium]|nr:6-carboxytetrahydropterin synthase [Bacteroidota bacterium]MCY4233238.1 6-carboxytetrahydropterin synthase [Bacteroidota bacterium]
MSTVYVTREVNFNAAHRLHNSAKSVEWNQSVFGKCNSENWHGHNYTLQVTVAGVPDPDTGYVIDLSILKQVIHDHVVRHIDHKNLNLDVPFLDGIIPSTENLVVAIWNQLSNALPSGKLYCVRLFETPRNSAEYFGPINET